MERNLGIIAEYNPFHNGHLYHIKKAKEKAMADAVVCVMSGNFVQRGDTSIVNKWTKAKMVLENGIDLVLELPTIYSVSSAENFAKRCHKNP
ncbi:MAG: nucleotidyltransferase family protein [Clostridia bacterium]|nr:nucleotidyltransferase family protein [Clostridia bacterium]